MRNFSGRLLATPLVVAVFLNTFIPPVHAMGAISDLFIYQASPTDKYFLMGSGIEDESIQENKLAPEARFWTTDSYLSHFYTRQNVNVGIGTVNPFVALQIGDGSQVNTDAQLGIIKTTASAGVSITSGSGQYSFVDFLQDDGTPGVDPGRPSLPIRSNITWDGNLKVLALNSFPNAQNTLINPSHGNVGIGTFSPDAKLSILTPRNGTNLVASFREADHDMGLNILGWNPGIGANYVFKDGVGFVAQKANKYPGEIVFQPDIGTWKLRIFEKQATDNTATTLLADPMTWTKEGRVGIGTDTPSAKLEIRGDTHLDWENGPLMVVSAANPAQKVSIGYDHDNDVGFISVLQSGVATKNLILQNGLGGYVGIGTISPSEKLDINGHIRIRSTNWEGGTIRLDGNNGTNMYLENINGDFRLVNSPWNAELFRVTQSGNVGIGTNSPSEKLQVNGNIKATDFLYSSDRRLKTNIVTISGALDKIKKLHGYSFDWKKDGKASIGLIAQEVEQIFPELVATESESGMKAVKYGNLVAPLIESVKTLSEQNERLEKKNQQLQSLVEDLGRRLQILEEHK